MRALTPALLAHGRLKSARSGARRRLRLTTHPRRTQSSASRRHFAVSGAYHPLMSALETLPPIRLTELTDCGGCAAKLGADLLADALSGLGVGAGAAAAPDELIAGLTPPDDAAAYRVSDELAIIGTLDFFPPLVDDARTFGEIAAANALSDVFAMGGRVLFALSIAAFPEDLPRDTLAAVFEGAASKVREAGGTLAGGHTIRDAEPKYGLAVIGAGHPDRLLRKGGARPGDVLLLTKRLGTGLLVSGHRQGKATEADFDRCDRPDANAEPGGVRDPRRQRNRRRDRRDRLRTAGARPRDGPSIGHPVRVRRREPCRRFRERSISPARASRPGVRRTTGDSSFRRCVRATASPRSS